MSRVEGKMSRVEGKCRGFKKTNKQNKTKQKTLKERKLKKTSRQPRISKRHPSDLQCARRTIAPPSPLWSPAKISLLNPLRIFQEGARFFEHEVKSTRLYFPPKRFHPQTNSTCLGSPHHPSSIVVFLQHRFFWSQTTLVIAADANHDFLEKNFFFSSQSACTRPFFIATIYLWSFMV